jgi:hypothetical protein
MDIDPGRVNSGEGFSGSSAEVAPQKEPLFNRISSPRVVIQSFARFFLFLLCPPFLIAMCVTHSIEDPQNPFFFITFLSHPKEKVKLEVKEKPSDSSSGDGSEDYEDYEDYDGRENETKVISEPEIKAPTQIEMSSSPINAESNGDNNKKNDHEGFLGEILDQEGITPNDTGEIFSLLDFSFLNNFIIETNFPQPSQYFTFEKNVERDDQPVGIIGDTRLYERECGSDGSCLYHSLANQIYNDSGQDREVRQDLFDGIMNLIGCANVDLQKIQEAYEWVKDWRKGNCRDAPGVLAAYEKLVEVKKSESESAKKVDLLKNNKAPEADIEEARAERNSKAAEVKVALGEFCGGIDRKLCSILQIEGFPESVERCPKPAEGDFSFESQSDSHKEISHAAAMILFACQQKRDYVWATSLSAAVLSG